MLCTTIVCLCHWVIVANQTCAVLGEGNVLFLDADGPDSQSPDGYIFLQQSRASPSVATPGGIQRPEERIRRGSRSFGVGWIPQETLARGGANQQVPLRHGLGTFVRCELESEPGCPASGLTSKMLHICIYCHIYFGDVLGTCVALLLSSACRYCQSRSSPSSPHSPHSDNCRTAEHGSMVT